MQLRHTNKLWSTNNRLSRQKRELLHFRRSFCA